MLPQTTENSGHSHTISNVVSNFTDPGPDGHVHVIICKPCMRTRKALGVQKYPTKWCKGHFHYYDSSILK